MKIEQIIEAAVQNNVGVLAIADHDTINGSLLIRQLCADSGIHYIPGVEISTLDGGKLFHILAYGFDVQNTEFTDFISHTRFLLDEMNVKLILAMQKDYNFISLQDYFGFIDEGQYGGWKALRYLLSKGVSNSIKDGVKFYSMYNIQFADSGFPPIPSTIYRIKKAGGYAILAHPGKVISIEDTAQFQKNIMCIMEYGLDGVECYYPTHSEIITQICVNICKVNNLLITTGSDCHGVFGKTRIGEMQITLEKLQLKDLLN